MRWIQDNPFLAGIAALTVVITGVMVFLLTQALGNYQLTTDAYTQAVQKLHGLQNRSPYPNDKNLADTKSLADQYKAELTKLREQLVKMESPLNPDIKPQQFQDTLRTTLTQTTEKAEKEGVVLPKDFYLGFGQYANTLPSEQAAPALARQLAIISQIVNRLIELKVQSIDKLDRRLLPEEGPAAPSAPNNAKKAPAIVERFPFDLGFSADQARFRSVLNSLLASEPFLILRTINIENNEKESPAINKSDASAASAAAAAPGSAPVSNSLDVVFGREFVRALMRIEIIDFSEPTEPKK